MRKAADRLVEQGIVARRQAGRAKLYSLNRSHLAAPYVEGLGSLRAQLIDRLKGSVGAWSIPPWAVLLFGSVARGDAGVESDLDLLVVRRPDTKEESSTWQDQLAALEREATAWTGNEARVIEYGKRDLAAPDVRGVTEAALRDGIPIFGGRLRLSRLLDRDGG